MQKGRDAILREVTIKYCNSSKQKLTLEGESSNDRNLPRYTNRAMRKIVIAELRKKIQHIHRR